MSESEMFTTPELVEMITNTRPIHLDEMFVMDQKIRSIRHSITELTEQKIEIEKMIRDKGELLPRWEQHLDDMIRQFVEEHK